MAISLENIVRSQRVRVAVGTCLAATGLWSFAPYALNDVGGDAYVNAPLVRISSPIAGVSGALPQIGTYVDATRKLRAVSARSIDDAALGALLGQQAALVAALDMAERQLREIAEADQSLAMRAARYRQSEGGRLVEQAKAASADTRACQAEAMDADAQAARVLALAAKEFASRATVERAQAAAASAHERCTALTARAAASAGAATAARSGVYLGTGNADTPYAEQQRDRLFLRRQELEVIATDARARLAELDDRINAERRRLAQALAYDVELPAGSVVWQVGASSGASVVPGSSLFELADCTKRFVEVTLPERRIETLVPGNKAKVRLIGSDDWQTGTIARITGAAARRDVAMVAADSSSQDVRALTVEVALPQAPTHGADRRCDIGRLAEVRFSRFSG